MKPPVFVKERSRWREEKSIIINTIPSLIIFSYVSFTIKPSKSDPESRLVIDISDKSNPTYSIDGSKKCASEPWVEALLKTVSKDDFSANFPKEFVLRSCGNGDYRYELSEDSKQDINFQNQILRGFFPFGHMHILRGTKPGPEFRDNTEPTPAPSESLVKTLRL